MHHPSLERRGLAQRTNHASLKKGDSLRSGVAPRLFNADSVPHHAAKCIGKGTLVDNLPGGGVDVVNGRSGLHASTARSTAS